MHKQSQSVFTQLQYYTVIVQTVSIFVQTIPHKIIRHRHGSCTGDTRSDIVLRTAFDMVTDI